MVPHTVASGNRITAATWSYTCVPVVTYKVTIQTGHVVTASDGLVQSLALSLMEKMQYETGGGFNSRAIDTDADLSEETETNRAKLFYSDVIGAESSG